MDFKWTPNLRRLYAELFVGLSHHSKRVWDAPMANGMYVGAPISAFGSVINIFKSFGLTYDTVDDPIDLNDVKSGFMPQERYPDSINGILPFNDDVIRGYFAKTDITPSEYAPNLLSTYINFVCAYADPSLSSSTTEFDIHSAYKSEMSALILNGYAAEAHGRYHWTPMMQSTFFECGFWNEDGIHRDEESKQFANKFFETHFDAKSLSLAKKICAQYGRLQAAEALEITHERKHGERTDKFLCELMYDAGWFDPFANDKF